MNLFPKSQTPRNKSAFNTCFQATESNITAVSFPSEKGLEERWEGGR